MNNKKTIGLLLSVLNDKEIDAYEKLILNIVLTSPKRNYYDMELLGDYIGTNRQLIARKLNNLIERGLIVRTKPKGKKYYLTYATETAKKKYLNVNIKDTPNWFNDYEEKLKDEVAKSESKQAEQDEHYAQYYANKLFGSSYMKGQ